MFKFGQILLFFVNLYNLKPSKYDSAVTGEADSIILHEPWQSLLFSFFHLKSILLDLITVFNDSSSDVEKLLSIGLYEAV